MTRLLCSIKFSSLCSDNLENQNGLISQLEIGIDIDFPDLWMKILVSLQSDDSNKIKKIQSLIKLYFYSQNVLRQYINYAGSTRLLLTLLLNNGKKKISQWTRHSRVNAHVCHQHSGYPWVS